MSHLKLSHYDEMESHFELIYFIRKTASMAYVQRELRSNRDDNYQWGISNPRLDVNCHLRTSVTPVQVTNRPK